MKAYFLAILVLGAPAFANLQPCTEILAAGEYTLPDDVNQRYAILKDLAERKASVFLYDKNGDPLISGFADRCFDAGDDTVIEVIAIGGFRKQCYTDLVAKVLVMSLKGAISAPPTISLTLKTATKTDDLINKIVPRHGSLSGVSSADREGLKISQFGREYLVTIHIDPSTDNVASIEFETEEDRAHFKDLTPTVLYQ